MKRYDTTNAAVTPNPIPISYTISLFARAPTANRNKQKNIYPTSGQLDNKYPGS